MSTSCADLTGYQGGEWRAATRQLTTTAALYACVWVLAYRGLEVGYWLTLLLAVPGAGLLVRLFIIQHDCGHGSFFPSRRLNEALGRVLAVVTLTPYQYWRRFHAMHHATSGNLDERGPYDVTTLTVREYRALAPWHRLKYRIYRHPVFLFGLAPTVLFVVLYRFPWIAPATWRRERRGILETDLAVVTLATVASSVVGLRDLLLVQLPITVLAASLGMWLFYVQHQFEETYWTPGDTWRFGEAGAVGSSCYDLPAPLQWITGNIGFHHIHHLNPRIPNYRLPRCFAETPALQAVTRLTMRESLRCARLKLWDTDRRRLVTFRDAAAPERR